MIITTPDPFRPGHFFTVRNPESIVKTHGDSHTACPVCAFLRDQITAAEGGFEIVPPRKE